MKNAFLEILTWKGTSAFGATHYYGKIRFGKNLVDVEFTLTKNEATKMNMDRDVDVFGRYKAGEFNTAFTDKKKLIKEAIKLFKKDPRGYDVLLLGNRITCDPQKMLVGPKDVMLAANILYEEFESHDGWGYRYSDRTIELDKKVRAICDKWDIVLGGPFWERG